MLLPTTCCSVVCWAAITAVGTLSPAGSSSTRLVFQQPPLDYVGVSPADSNREHTLGTLRYARRAMSIKNSLHRSVMGPAEELAYLRELVLQLQDENAQLKQVIVDAGLQQQVAVGVGAVAATPLQKLSQMQRPDSVCELYVKAC